MLLSPSQKDSNRPVIAFSISTLNFRDSFDAQRQSGLSDLNFESQDIPVNVIDFDLAGLRSAGETLASSLLRQFKHE